MISLLKQILDAHHVPGAAIAIVHGSKAPECLVYGTDRDGVALAADSLFPVASLTKLATALAMLRLVEAGKLALDDPVERFMPEAALASHGATLRSLPAHTSGLPFLYDQQATPWTKGLDWPAIARACLATAPIAPPGRQVIYSNVGYTLAAVAIERASGQLFKDVLRALVLDPLGLDAYLGVEPARKPVAILDPSDPYAGTSLDFRNSAFFRALASPYSGLLTSLDGALRLIGAWRGQAAGFLRPETLAEATTDQTGGLGGGPGELTWLRCPWGLGPELRGEKTPHWAPAEASSGSFGHVGGSGCMVWTDPAHDITWAILTTRAMDTDWTLEAFPAIGSAILGRSYSNEQ